ncbi:uncharacterized protein LOC112525593 [Cynara cardunculus var. scolymus]|uniref:uncharacterized protein LOC112525593 n=1 Tax=Cynara cardunculus var. scolymus TaxID=59895 RepID=UPI000D623804|nr:uncharacterized protein LOC112525593 [Cynara cardunculus var. scolymus]
MHLGSNGDMNAIRQEHPVKIPGASNRRSKSEPAAADGTHGSAKMAQLMPIKYILVDIIGNQLTMPLYMGALFEKHNIVKYPHHASQKMINDSRIIQNQVWVLLKCVEVWVLLNCVVADIFYPYASKKN